MRPHRFDSSNFRITGSTVAAGAAMARHREEPDESLGHIGALATMHSGLDDTADPKELDASVVAGLRFSSAFAVSDSRDPEADNLRHLKARAAGDKLVPAPAP